MTHNSVERTRLVSQYFWPSLTDNGILGRFGGEEFVVLLQRSPLSETLSAAEMLRRRVESLAVQLNGQLPVTVSIGVRMVYSCRTIDAVLQEADAALYLAKAKGRNQVEHYDSGA
ncbi:MAG: GGDEF domain-containing protein [Elainellaceae cyanobacterium]